MCTYNTVDLVHINHKNWIYKNLPLVTVIKQQYLNFQNKLFCLQNCYGRWNPGQMGCRPGGMQDRWDGELVGFRTGVM